MSVFIARAVQSGRPVTPDNDILDIFEVPRSIECHAACHPDCIKKFPDTSPGKISPILMGNNCPWKHKLNLLQVNNSFMGQLFLGKLLLEL
jgi:hypothetical protein